MIQVQRLEGFYRVGKAGGYTRAAKTFSYPITQPGVHQQVLARGVQMHERALDEPGEQALPVAGGEDLAERVRAPQFVPRHVRRGEQVQIVIAQHDDRVVCQRVHEPQRGE